MIQIRNIQVKKGTKTIIKNASFQIQAGKISVAIGKNGAGKSTLLEALTRSNPLESGAIVWDRQPLGQLTAQTLAQRRAVLSQKVDIGFSLRVDELVEIGTYVAEQSLSTVKIESLIRHALQSVGMLDFMHRDFNTLSGGEQKRVLLAKCIAQLNCCHWADQNKYLFLDEPTASLDIEQQYKFIGLVKRLVKRRNIGVFAVLHDINLAAQFADEILLLRDGRIIDKGIPYEMLTTQKLQDTFNIHAIVKPHPILGCPHITILPQQNQIISSTSSTHL